MPNNRSRFQPYVAELVGTFALVFAGAGSIVINDVSGGAVTHLGIAITFGLIVMAMIYSLGEVSGAHINPVVTIGFALSGRFPSRKIAPYVSAQIAGGCMAGYLLRWMFPDHATLGSTLITGSVGRGLGMETLLTFLLMFVILRTATGAREKGIMAGAAIGATVALEALFAGPITGASMNPARSIGPALASMTFDNLWVYIVAPLAGAVLAVLLANTMEPSTEQISDRSEQ